VSRPADVPFDAPAVERGAGFFETVLLTGRRAVLWLQHLDRFFAAVSRWEFPAPSRGALEAETARLVDEAAPAPSEERGLRLAWIAVGSELERTESWRLDVSLRPVPPLTLRRRDGVHGITLPPELRRDTPSTKSTSYFAAVAGLRMAVKRGGEEGLFTDPDGAYLEGTSTALVAWNGGLPVRPRGGALPSVTGAAFAPEPGPGLSLSEPLLRDGAVLCGSLTLTAPLLSLDGKPCVRPPAMLERIADFNGRLRTDPGLGRAF
jgi:4-amino-4-deoxychorismate lyase